MSFHALSYASHAFSFLDVNRNMHKTRLGPALAEPPPSVLLPADEGGKFHESKKGPGSNAPSTSSDSTGSLPSQANTVGIIGGVSVDSSLKFLRKLVDWSSKDGESSLPFILDSDPVLYKELLSQGRSFSSLSSKSKGSRLNPITVVENLRNKRVFLENSGARCIVMPCNILHSWHDEVSKGCSVPFLHMGESVARELKEAKLKPLEAGSHLRIGVLATDATLSAGFYQEKLQNEGFEIVLPDKATMEHAVIPAFEALNRKDMEGARNLFRIALQVLLVRAVNSVILASDDMLDLLPRDDPLLKKCIDPMDALVRSTIKWARSAEKGS